MTDAEFNQRAAEIEKIIGRKPTQSEVYRNDLDRPDTRSIRDKVFAAGRTVPMARPDDPITAELMAKKAELQKKSEWQQYLKSSQDERLVKDYEHLIAKRHEALEADKEAREHLKAMEKDLTPLRQLREKMRWNEQYDILTVEETEFAIRIGETPGHDTQAFKVIRDKLIDAEEIRAEKAKFDREAQIAALKAEIDRIDSARIQRPVEPEPTPDEKLEALRARNVRRAEIRKAHYAEINRLVDERKYDEAEELSDRGPDYGDAA